MLSLVTQQGGEVWGKLSLRPRSPKLFSLLLPAHERRTLIESGHAAGRGRRGEVVQTPKDSKLCFYFFFFSRGRTLIEFGHAAGRGGGEVIQTPRDSKVCSYFFFLSKE